MKCKTDCPLNEICEQRLQVGEYYEELYIQYDYEMLQHAMTVSEGRGDITEQLTAIISSMATSRALLRYRIQLSAEKALQEFEQISCSGPKKVRASFLGGILEVRCCNQNRVDRLANHLMLNEPVTSELSPMSGVD